MGPWIVPSVNGWKLNASVLATATPPLDVTTRTCSSKRSELPPLVLQTAWLTGESLVQYNAAQHTFNVKSVMTQQRQKEEERGGGAIYETRSCTTSTFFPRKFYFYFQNFVTSLVMIQNSSSPRFKCFTVYRFCDKYNGVIYVKLYNINLMQ
jgi:hypothetical protein